MVPTWLIRCILYRVRKKRKVWWIVVGVASLGALYGTGIAVRAQTPDAKLEAALREAFVASGLEKIERPAPGFGGSLHDVDRYKSKELAFSEVVEIARKLESGFPDCTLYEDSTGSYVVLTTGTSFRSLVQVAIWPNMSETLSGDRVGEQFTTIEITRRGYASFADRVRSWLPW